MRVYLSGGMEYADGEGASWRQELQDWLERELHWTVFNPNVESDKFFATLSPLVPDFRQLKIDNVKRYQEIVRHLVEIDCREIAECSDLVVCLWDDGAMKGAGTKGELTIAHHFHKPVYLVTSIPLPEIPGWVLGCTTKFFGSFNELKTHLLGDARLRKG